MKLSTRFRSSLQYRLAGALTLGLLAYAVLAGSVSLYWNWHAEIDAAATLERQLVRTIQTQAEVAAFARNAEIADDLLKGLLTNDTIQAVRLVSSDGFDRGLRQTGSHHHIESAQIYPLFSPIDHTTRIGELYVSVDKDVVRSRALHAALQAMAFFLSQICITAVLLGAVFARVAGRPLSNLAKALEGIAPGSGRRLNIEPAHQHDEIGRLSHSVNSMLNAAEHALQEERNLRELVETMEGHYRRIFKSTDVGILVLNSRGELLFNNQTTFLKKLTANVNWSADKDFVHAIFTQSDLFWALVHEADLSRQAVGADLQLKSEEGDTPRWLHGIISVRHNPHGRIDIIEGVFYDVTTRHQRERAVLEQAESDALTGLRNRHGIERFVAHALRHAQECEQNVGFMLIDLDGFKAVNDRYGHTSGDLVLVEVADRLRHCVRRASDLIGRLGGDEFVVVVPNAGVAPAMLAQLAGEIIASLSKPICLPGEIAVQISASVGIARFPLDGATLERLYERADQAMYAVKQDGKDGFVFASVA